MVGALYKKYGDHLMSEDKLKEIAATFPSREDILLTFEEMQELLRSEPIEQRQCERLLRLLRRKVDLALKIEKSLRKYRGKK